MPTRAKLITYGLVSGVTLLCVATNAVAQELRFRPAASTGNVVCMPGQGECGETEIMLSGGGVTVTVFLEVGEWADNPWDQLLGAYYGTLDAESLEGGDATNPGTLDGVDLVPVGQPDMGYEGAFQALKVCHGPPYTPAQAQLLTKCSSPADCQVGESCLDRWDYIFYQLDSTAIVSTASLNYSWTAASMDCAEDDGTFKYGGTLLLDVPVGARGTYNVRFFGETGYTGWSPCASPVEPGYRSTPAQITIATGRCCSDIGVGTSVCEDGLHDNECDARPGPRLFVPGASCYGESVADCDDNGVPDECDILAGDCNNNGIPDECDAVGRDCNGNAIPDDCEADRDGDGVIDECEGCPNDPNKTDPGICGCGVDDNADADGDDVPDCIDECPGVDDAVFAPDCAGPIPTVSAWGLAVMTLLLLLVAKLYARRRRTQ